MHEFTHFFITFPRNEILFLFNLKTSLYFYRCPLLCSFNFVFSDDICVIMELVITTIHL